MKTIITIEHADQGALERSILWKAIMAHFMTGYNRHVSVVEIEPDGDGADLSPSPRRHAQPTAPPSEGASERQGAPIDDDATLHRVAGAKFIGTLRAGSRVYLAPSGDWFLEVHPDHPPRMHFADGRPMVELGNVSETVKQDGPKGGGNEQ